MILPRVRSRGLDLLGPAGDVSVQLCSMLATQTKLRLPSGDQCVVPVSVLYS